MLRILTLTSLYPNVVQPRHGVFVEQRLQQLLDTGRVEATIVAPVPWFPLRSPLFGRYATFARVPARETRLGRTVHHPRYLTIPRAGMWAAPFLMARCLEGPVGRLCRRPVQVIDSHFLYPDGVAACHLGRKLGIPVVLTARGSDVNLFMRHAGPRRRILEAIRGCARVITVSGALRDALLAHGVEPHRVVVLRNGVDLRAFQPEDRDAARAALGIKGPLLLSVGNLLELKGHDLLIRALPQLPGVHAAIIGDGPRARELQRVARECGVHDRVLLLANLPQPELRRWYSAADALVLASSREGMPNVVLESLACGTPVIATAVGGIPEVVNTPAAGALLPDRSADAVARVATRLLNDPPPREAVRTHATGFGWQPTVDALLDLFRDVAGGGKAAHG